MARCTRAIALGGTHDSSVDAEWSADKGVPQDWWYGHYVLLKEPSQKVRIVAGANRFALVVIEREDWQVEPVLEILGTQLLQPLAGESRGRPTKG